MPAPRRTGTPPRAQHAQKKRAARRARRFALLALLATVLLVTLLLTAFGSGSPAVVPTQTPVAASRLIPAGPPQPLVVATQGSLQLQLPIARSQVTALGYHGAGDGSLALSPLGRLGNEGFFSRLFHGVFGSSRGGLTYYALEGGTGATTGELDVGAAPGTDVYAPVDGTVVGLTPYVLDGRAYGVRLDLQPSSTPSVVVSVGNLRPDLALSVGSTVASAGTRIGSVLDLSGVERQALARFTQDAGNHVSLQVRPAATLALP